MELALLWLVFAVFAMIGATQKNRSGVGWFLVGLLLGPFGLLVYLMPKARFQTSRDTLRVRSTSARAAMGWICRS